MKTEKELKERLKKINVMLSEELEIYISRVKVNELKREKEFLESIGVSNE